MTKTAKSRILGKAETPTGETGMLIECTCATHRGKGRAVVNAACGDGLTIHPDRIHGFVTLAHDPFLARAPQIRRNGPWAV